MKLPYFDLSGKVAVITGGATGIGRGISDGLADAGASVVLCARRINVLEEACAEIAQKTGVKTLPHRLDITSTDEINTLVNDVVKEFGHIDILVNNAGVGGSEKPILEMSEEDWDNTVNTDLRGIFLLSQAVGKEMVKQGTGGKVINVASIGGEIIFPNMSAYCASKGGVIQLTKVMALEWIRYNIQVNAILPGYIETPMNTHFFATDVGKKIIKKNIPMNRLGQQDEMKGLAVYLASPASSFMTGSAIIIDGGQTCW
ncbi:MAG TPA: SDR family oxidoreductase [Deltaproteobacteria bacterium]|nr:SDR family oxidoreductase [Deltaproteobacteria bacterium]